MDPVTLVVTALTAGAVLGVQDTASALVEDAYASLKALVGRHLGGRADAEMILARHEQAPEVWQAPLIAELARTGAGRDGDLIAAAQALLDLAGEAGEAVPRYAVDARGAQGVQIGDRNLQDNVFNAPGERLRAADMATGIWRAQARAGGATGRTRSLRVPAR
jgi:hypothetical protein